MTPAETCDHCGQRLPHKGASWREAGACRRNEPTPAEELTTAAAQLEAMVAGATPGPWCWTRALGHSLPSGEYPGASVFDAAGNYLCEDVDNETARLVALLRNLAPNLPELLRAEGERMGGLIALDYEGNPMCTPNPHLLAIAREVNETGESK